MPDFTILRASFKDLGSLRNLEKICFEKDAWPLIDLIGVLTLPGIIRIKAVVREDMVGFAAGDTHPERETGWITTVGVHPDFRRQGIARAMISKIEQLLGMPRVRLSVRPSNLEAIKLYSRLGYHQSGVWPKYYFDGEDALVMERNIPKVI